MNKLSRFTKEPETVFITERSQSTASISIAAASL